MEYKYQYKATENKSKTFTSKDYVTIGISIFALVTSLTAFYFSNLRVEDNLQARIVDVDELRNIKDSLSEDTAIIQVAFINAGNRQAIVLRPTFQLADTTNAYNGAWGGKVNEANPFPLILQPREMKLVGIKICVSEINLNPGKVTDSSQGGKTYQSFCQLQFFGLDSKGDNHQMNSDFAVQIITGENSINSILTANNRDFNSYKPIRIF